jgi:hypothetical protein
LTLLKVWNIRNNAVRKSYARSFATALVRASLSENPNQAKEQNV